MTCNPSGFSIHGTSQARILEQAAIFFLHGIVQTQGLNPHLLHWQVCSLPLGHQGSTNVKFMSRLFCVHLHMLHLTLQ